MVPESLRRRFAALLALGLAFLIAACGGDEGANEMPLEEEPFSIGLVYTAPHELINQVVLGFKEGLATGLQGGFSIVEKHANGDVTQFAPTVNSTIAAGLDLLVPVTTPISQIALKAAPNNLPVCFLAVTDPVGAGLVESLDEPVLGTGVSDLAPFESVLRFIRETVPSARTIGLPYNPEEQPAVFGRDQVLKYAPRFGFEIDPKAVTSKDEFSSLIRHLAATNDLLVIGSDNAMFEASPTIVKSALDARRPVFAGDSTSIKNGAVGGLTIDYYQVGWEGAKLAIRILKGEKAGAIPVVVLNEGVLELNLGTAQQLGIAFSSGVLAEARTIHR
jgi:putative ABC transport system substrate-binding protein